MAKYLYGASVQGIQEFIFKTNKLREIVGASEIVKDVANKFINNYKPNEILINAAGNIKALFDNYDDCQKVVLEFGKIIQQSAYGISISQAVVKIENNYTQEDINKLESRLKIQRNKPTIALDMSLNIMKLNPSTAKPSIKKDTDIATQQKLNAYKKWLDSPEKSRNKKFRDISDFSNSKNKIAVIHIDGNGLGQLIPNLNKKYNLTLSKFSVKLDLATQKAFDDARDDTMNIREVVLGGDDVTVICNANDALEFTKRFLTNFEKETSESFTKLTACAGIAYCNEKYPFHYAVDLAEALCGVAKNHSERKSSSLMFHNIQSASYQSWDKFLKDELTIINDNQTIRCDFGAYYLDDKENEAHISSFINTLEAYRCDGSPISRLRNWLSELYNSDKNAKNLLDRINTITNQKNNWNCKIMDKNLKYFNKDLSNDTLIINKDGYQKTPIYDILQILSITTSKSGDK